MFKTDFIFCQQKIEFKPECLPWSCHYTTGCFVALLGDISVLKYGKKICIHSRAFSLSTPTFLLSTPVENSEARWKKATKCNKYDIWCDILFFHELIQGVFSVV